MTLMRTLALSGLTLLSCSAASATEPPPQGVLNLSASASREVAKDMISVTLNTTREGADAATVQAGLKQALDAALAVARKAAVPGQIEVRTGNFSLFPRYANKGITGWQGSAEMVIEGRDIPGIAELAGQVGTLTIARVNSALSREQREKAESEMADEAIANYRTKAAQYVRQFGYTAFAVREVRVGAQESGAPQLELARRTLASSAVSESLPVELGKSVVVLNVTGSVQMTK
jgi:predicted secreted protein